MSDVRDAYIRATYDLSKHAPAEWATFVEAFRAYTVYELERMLTSPTSEVQVSFGMGRRMRELRDEFAGIEGMALRLVR